MAIQRDFFGALVSPVPPVSPRVYKPSKEEALIMHRKEWELLKANPTLTKTEAIKMLGFTRTKVLHDCFLCHYSYNEALSSGMSHDKANGPKLNGRCKFCPVVWPEGMCTTEMGNPKEFIFQKWANTDSIRSKTKLADEILNMPEKEEASPLGDFDEIRVIHERGNFRVAAYKDGYQIDSGNIVTILGNGEGMYLHIGVNTNAFKTEGDNSIKMVDSVPD